MRNTAFGDNSLGRTQIFEWIFTLKYEKTWVELCGSLGCPSAGRTDDCAKKVCEAVGEDLQRTFTVMVYG